MGQVSRIEPSQGVPIYHRGPSQDAGPLPTLIYFALSGEESLSLPPINEPVEVAVKKGCRAISFTIPGHGPAFDSSKAMAFWADAIEGEPQIFNHFFEQIKLSLNFLIEQKIVDPTKISVAGLSRGGFIAVHLAARDERIEKVLAFAPVTDLLALSEFHRLKELPAIQQLKLTSLIESLIHKKICFYLGNHDIRVDVDSCIEFVRKLTERQYEAGIRSPQVELTLFPSQGHKGHGTPERIFQEGTERILL